MKNLTSLAALLLACIVVASPSGGTPSYQSQDPSTFGWAGEKMPSGMRRGTNKGEYVWEKDGSIMVYVPAGQSLMGWDWAIPDTKPVHTVRLDAFYIDKYEVRRGAFKRFVDSTAYKTTAERVGTGGVVRPQGTERAAGKSWRDPDFPQDDTHPVVLVSWDDAKAYAAWSGKSLPTEAQWEKAASWDEAALEGKKKRLHPWGDTQAAGRGAGTANLLKRGNFADVNFGNLMPEGAQFKGLLLDPNYGGQYDDGYVYTAPIGQFLDGVSPYGAFDMSGNVWEWCEDGYDKDFYSRPATNNPVNLDGRNGRVIRGSGYDTPSTGPHPSAYRSYLPADGRFTTIGFRCVIRASRPDSAPERIRIVSKFNDKVLGVKPGLGGEVDTFKRGAPEQKLWRIIPLSDMYYKIIAEGSEDKVLTMSSDIDDNEWAIIFGWHSNDDDAWWSIVPADDGSFYIKVKSSGKCLGIDHDSNRLPVDEFQMNTCNRSENQKWKFESVSPN